MIAIRRQKGSDVPVLDVERPAAPLNVQQVALRLRSLAQGRSALVPRQGRRERPRGEPQHPAPAPRRHRQRVRLARHGDGPLCGPVEPQVPHREGSAVRDPQLGPAGGVAGDLGDREPVVALQQQCPVPTQELPRPDGLPGADRREKPALPRQRVLVHGQHLRVGVRLEVVLVQAAHRRAQQQWRHQDGPDAELRPAARPRQRARRVRRRAQQHVRVVEAARPRGPPQRGGDLIRVLARVPLDAVRADAPRVRQSFSPARVRGVVGEVRHRILVAATTD
mmetsp:Transcript_62967/g.168519  ORF Transcript_62967/g.168519 Transcript_62967/m.168519 type:complete len:279 (+) Transcript_62967:123-959(+)